MNGYEKAIDYDRLNEIVIELDEENKKIKQINNNLTEDNVYLTININKLYLDNANLLNMRDYLKDNIEELQKIIVILERNISEIEGKKIKK